MDSNSKFPIHRCIGLLTLVGCLLSLSIFASDQDDATETDERLDEVTVIASRLQPITLGLEATELSEYSSQVTWVELLQSLRSKYVSRSGTRGALTQLRVRGSEADHVKIMLNGVPLHTSVSEAHFGAISAIGIDQIQAINGPRSTVWGSPALAGVINLSTKPSKTTNQFYADTGSFGSLGYGIDLGTDLGGLSVSMNLAERTSDGVNIAREGSETDGFDQSTAHFGFEKDGPVLTWNGFARHTSTLSQYDPIPRDGDRLTDTENLVLGQSMQWTVDEGNTILLEMSQTHTDLANLAQSVQSNSWKGNLNRAALVGTFQLTESHGISLAIDRVNEDFNQMGTASAFGDPNYEESMHTTGFATEYLFSINSWQVNASARRENNSDFGGSSTWQASITRHTDRNRWSYTTGTGMKNPSFIERFGFTPDSFLGNPDLDPEHALEHQLAYVLSLGRHRSTVMVFHNTLKNEINGFAYDVDSGQFTTRNRDRTSERIGLEFSHEIRFEQGAVDLSMSYVNSKEGDEREIRRPKLLAHIGAQLALTPKISVKGSASYTSNQLDRDFSSFPSSLVTLDSFTLVRLGINYELLEKTNLYLDVDNALDADYEMVFGFGNVGRSFHAGARVAF